MLILQPCFDERDLLTEVFSFFFGVVIYPVNILLLSNFFLITTTVLWSRPVELNKPYASLEME